MIFNLKKINTSSIKYSKKLKYIFILSIFIFSYKNIERFVVSNELFFQKLGLQLISTMSYTIMRLRL